MSRISEIKHIADYADASPKALASLISEAELLEPLVIEDDRPYHHFKVFPIPNHGRLSMANWMLCGYSGDDDKLDLPATVKSVYRTRESAQDVWDLLQKMFVGKTRKECERLLGID